MNTYKQSQREFFELTQSLAEKAFYLIVRNVHDYVYIVGQKTGTEQGIWSSISVCRGSETPTEWLTVNGEHIRRNATVEMMRDQIEKILKREPLYIFNS